MKPEWILQLGMQKLCGRQSVWFGKARLSFQIGKRPSVESAARPPRPHDVADSRPGGGRSAVGVRILMKEASVLGVVVGVVRKMR